jgi:hypothetical protein
MRRNDRTGGFPTDVVFVDTETYPSPDDPTRQLLDFGCAEHWRDGTLRAELTFENAHQLWDWVERRALAKHRLWVYAHNMSGFDFMVLQGEREWKERGWETTATIVPRPFLYRVRRDGRTINICDSLNIYSQPGMSALADLGRMLGFPKGTDPGVTAPRAERVTYCQRDVEILRRAMFTWWDFCADLDFGYCAFTTAGQAMNAFRHRFMGDEVPIIDHRPRAAALERLAYCGGRTDAMYVGAFTEHVDAYDVNSMYPYVMRDRLYPVELVTMNRHYNATVDDIRDRIAQGFGCIATVRIRTTEPLYPRKGERLYFPVGEFVTTLCTESLSRALSRGDLISIEGDVAYYRMAPLFRGWVDELYALRMRYRSEGNDVYDRLCKLIMNALYGKFGQMTPDWTDIDMSNSAVRDALVTMRDMGLATLRVVAEGSAPVNLRIIGERAEQQTERTEAYNAMCAVAAHVTDYARNWLWEFVHTAGAVNVLYVDTDSLYVNAIGSARLRGLVSNDLGALKLERSSPEGMIIHGVKDYVIGDIIKRKGVRKSAVELEPGVFVQDRFRGFLGAMRAGQLDVMIVGPTMKRLKRSYLKGIPPPGGVGRTSPFVLAEVA